MRLKIFDYLWHIPHQYDMMYALRENCDFYFGLNVKAQWDHSKRKVPPNLKFVTHYEPGNYDLALLHIDQQVVAQKHLKTLIYNNFNEVINDVPKIVINHGTPVLTEWFQNNGYGHDQEDLQKICITAIKELIGDNTMIVNSYAASGDQEWGFGHPVVHGINSLDWYDIPKEPRVFTAISSAGFNDYYNRPCLSDVTHILAERYGYTLYHAKVNTDTGSSPDAYKKFLGSSLLYFDPSYRTPMNRARTEAFLSGCCVIQVEGAHDLERWAVPGENILLVPNNPNIIASTLVDFIENRYEEAIRIGQNGKRMAEKVFHPDRYRDDLMRIFNLALSKEFSS